MPGNEVGDKIHNFLGQESLSQGQHHSQVIDGTWSGLSNNLLIGSQRQVGGPLVPNVKNFSVYQLESDRGENGQPSSLQSGLNFTQSGLRPETARSQSQPIANGYMQGHQAFQARQNETNFLGVGTTSRGLSILDSQIGNVPDLHKKNSMRQESTGSPLNYDFFGGQQQISGQHPGMVQPLPRQQSGMTDMQLLQQHAILKQMPELQRQQLTKLQFQLSEGRLLNSTNQVSSAVKQVSDNLSPAPINGVPVHDASNYSWQPENMTPNANWLLQGASPAMQGSSGGFMIFPDQGQVRMMDFGPQQVDQSFYGISTGGARGNPYQHPSVQMDKPLVQQVPENSNSFPDNQYTMFSDQVGLQDGTVVSRQGDQGKHVFGAGAGQGLGTVFHSENMQQMTIPPKNAVMQESHRRQENLGPPETSLEATAIQAASSQNAATLDPTEEKFLFGSDDSVWDIFGKSTNTGSVLDSTDTFGSFPSLHSGSWSALMQSAVAETSSSGVQEDWSGLGQHNNEVPIGGNMPTSIVNDSSKQQSAWAYNNLQKASTLNSKPFTMSTDVNISVPGVLQSGVHTANEQTVRMHNDSSHIFVQQLTEERSRWSDCSPLQKPVADTAQLFGNISQSPDVQTSPNSISCHQGIVAYDRHSQPQNKQSSWKFIESTSCNGGSILKSQDIESSLQPFQNNDHRGSMSERGHGSALDFPIRDENIESGDVNSSLRSPQVNKEGSEPDNIAQTRDLGTTWKENNQQLPNKHNLTHWKSIDSKVTSGLSRVPAKYQQNQDNSPQTFDSSGNDCLENGVSEANMSENQNAKETSNGSFSSNFSYHTSTGGVRDNVWVDANNPQGGKQNSSVYVVHKPSGTRKFQYHPMGDLDAEVEHSYGTKCVTHLQEIPRHVSQGLKGLNQGYFGQSKYAGHAAGESTETEKGFVPGIKADEVPFKSPDPGSAPERTFGGFMPGKTALISQNMSELHQKVDQPREHGTATHLSSSEHDQSSEKPDAETSDGSVGQFQHIRPSTSRTEQPARTEQVLPMNVANQSPASVQRDIEAFGRSLRPNNAVHQKFSLWHQVQAMKNTEIDPSNRSVKRFKGPPPDSGMDAQELSSQVAEQLFYGSNSMMRDASVNHPLVPSGDSKMLNFSPSTGDKNETHLSSNDMLSLARSNSQHLPNADNSASNLRDEHSQISPRMAPSWFDRYGTYTNGKMLPLYDARKIAMMKAMENASVVSRPSDNLHNIHSSELVSATDAASQLDNAWQNSNLMPIASELISPNLLPPDSTNRNLVLKAKKRKSMTFECLPWHREVTQGSQRPQKISVAEMEWAHAANRLVDKIADEPEKDWLPVLRSKGRLILTTQLMQQLLRAPPRIVLSADASKNYETVAYFVSRSVLGDACSMACIFESDTVHPDSGKTLYEKQEERNQSTLKAAEEFIIRAKMLENDLQSLDKRASILNLILECQDLEKFSIINRFAKFHGRGQADGAETSSSSNAIASHHKSFPQRYVTALPMPKNIPDRVQCLSLGSAVMSQ